MTKRILSAILSAVLLLSFSGCDKVADVNPVDSIESESHTLDVRTSEIREEFRRDDNGKLYYYCSYPEITLSPEDEEKHPELAKALSELSAEKKEITSKSAEEMTEVARETIDSFPDYDMVLYNTAVAMVRRADDVVLSLQLYYDSYSGGAHGYYFYDGYTFDTKTGKLLSYTDVITDKEAFLDAIANELDEIRDQLYTDERTNIRELIEGENMFSWSLENNGITVSFAPYSIAPFASGAPTVTISDIEYPGLIKEEYISELDFFATEMHWDNFSYDVTGDGNPDRITVGIWPDYNYETGEGQIFLSVNGKEYRKDVGNLGKGEATFVKTPKGKCYVLMSLHYVNPEENRILSFELSENPGEPKVLEGLSFCYEDSEKAPQKRVITNPESFYLESSDGNAYEFRMGESGLPERIEE